MSFDSSSSSNLPKGRSLDDFHQGEEETDNSQDDFGLDLVDELSEHPDQPAVRPVKKWMLVAGMLAILIVGALVLFSVTAPKDNSSAIVNASDAQKSTQTVTNGGNVNVVISQSEDGIAVQATDLPPAPEGFDYQWSASNKDGSIRRLAALKDDKTDQWVGVSSLSTLDDLSLSLETDGGLDVPEGEPLVVVDAP